MYGNLRRRTLPHVDVRRRRTSRPRVDCVNVRRRMPRLTQAKQGLNTPLIWCMSYHVTSSSHVIGHFLRTLCSLSYMRCVACCWKSCLTPALHVLEGAAASCRRLEVYPGLSNDLSWDNYRLYIVVERTTCWPIVWSVPARNARMKRVFMLTISRDLCATWYHKIEESAIDIVISRDRYEPHIGIQRVCR